MALPYYTDDMVTLHHGDCLDVMRTLADNSVDAVVCDPPYDLTAGKKGGTGAASVNLNSPAGRARITAGFMGQSWDGTGVAFRVETWTEAFRVLKPGGHLLAFGGTRTWHRLAVAVEDAGFEMRDSIAWLYGSGFPKSLDVSKAIDKAAGATREVVGLKASNRPNVVGLDPGGSMGGGAYTERLETAPATPDAERWQGWGTALKPAFEPIVVARKPLSGTVAANVLAHGTGALNVDGCRTGTQAQMPSKTGLTRAATGEFLSVGETVYERHDAGRWPTNVLLDGSQADALDEQSGTLTSGSRQAGVYRGLGYMGSDATDYPAVEGDSGGASRFFPTFRYEAKAPTAERPSYVQDDGADTWAKAGIRKRCANCGRQEVNVPGSMCECPEPDFQPDPSMRGKVSHPTVKPLDLMRWLVRLVTPPGGTVLEPFAGSGTTAEACVIEGFRCIAIEREAAYLPLIVARLSKPIQVDLFGGVA